MKNNTQKNGRGLIKQELSKWIEEHEEKMFKLYITQKIFLIEIIDKSVLKQKITTSKDPKNHCVRCARNVHKKTYTGCSCQCHQYE